MIEQPATNKIRIVEKKSKVKKAENIQGTQNVQTTKSSHSVQKEETPPRKKNSKNSLKNDKKNTVVEKNKLQKEISAKVTKVAPNGLEITLASGEVAFLPKENMHIGKKKKLEEIFSEGYIIHAFIKTQKGEKITLTQKEEAPRQNKKTAEKAPKDEKKTSRKQKKHRKEEQPSKISEQEAKELLQEAKEEVPKQKTLKDLKKLQSIGNMKITVGRGKKSNLTQLAEEKEEKPAALPKVPEGLLENIIESTKEATEKYSELTEELRKRNLLENAYD